MNIRTIYFSQTIVLAIIAIIIGLAFVAAIVVISIGKIFDADWIV